MQYGQIVFLLFIAFLFYYAVLIVLDIQKAKMAQAAEQENHTEEEIDISDEAQSFKPIKVGREEPSKSRRVIMMTRKNRAKNDIIPATVKPS